MPDAEQGPRSWFERLSSPADAEPTEPNRSDTEAATPNGPSDGGAPQPPPAPAQRAEAGPPPAAAAPTGPDVAAPSGPSPAPQVPPAPVPSGAADEGSSGASRKWQIEELQHRWLITQAQLLDNPRDAVHEAGVLVGEAMQLVAAAFGEQRDQIERDWKENADLDTDELRAVMQRYRKLFQYVLRASQSPES